MNRYILYITILVAFVESRLLVLDDIGLSGQNTNGNAYPPSIYQKMLNHSSDGNVNVVPLASNAMGIPAPTPNSGNMVMPNTNMYNSTNTNNGINKYPIPSNHILSNNAIAAPQFANPIPNNYPRQFAKNPVLNNAILNNSPRVNIVPTHLNNPIPAISHIVPSQPIYNLPINSPQQSSYQNNSQIPEKHIIHRHKPNNKLNNSNNKRYAQNSDSTDSNIDQIPSDSVSYPSENKDFNDSSDNEHKSKPVYSKRKYNKNKSFNHTKNTHSKNNSHASNKKEPIEIGTPLYSEEVASSTNNSKTVTTTVTATTSISNPISTTSKSSIPDILKNPIPKEYPDLPKSVPVPPELKQSDPKEIGDYINEHNKDIESASKARRSFINAKLKELEQNENKNIGKLDNLKNIKNDEMKKIEKVIEQINKLKTLINSSKSIDASNKQDISNLEKSISDNDVKHRLEEIEIMKLSKQLNEKKNRLALLEDSNSIFKSRLQNMENEKNQSNEHMKLAENKLAYYMRTLQSLQSGIKLIKDNISELESFANKEKIMQNNLEFERDQVETDLHEPLFARYI